MRKPKRGPVLWLANLTSEPHKLKIGGMAGPATVHIIGESNFAAAAMRADFLAGTTVKKVSAFELGPFEVARFAAA